MGENLIRRTSRYLFEGDKVIWIVFFIMCAISLIEVYSAASRVTFNPLTNYWDPIVKHAAFLAVGIMIVIVTHNIPCRWYKFYILMVPMSWLLLLLALVTGSSRNGGARWLPLMGGLTFQPSELAKGAVVVGAAFLLSALQTERGADRRAFKYILYGLVVPTCLLIVTENFSTAALLFLVSVLLMFVGRVPLVQLGKLMGVLALAGTLLVSILMVTPDQALYDLHKNKVTRAVAHRAITWKHRIDDFLSHRDTRELSAKDFDIQEKEQENHAKIAIATSNVVGRFPGNSVQRDFLSHAESDFIYAIIIEETGLLGGAFVVLLYVVLLFRASRIANRCERNFPAFLVLGLALLLVTQALVNMAVAVGLMPVTGQPLPLISQGGSSVIINCVYIGMILSVSRFAKQRSAQPVAEPSPVVEEEFQRADGME